ncbi:MAG: D-alanine--D-alanine ligase [Lachnospiraceae bacterium]|nr:D-alanine--D-alanine ligase [Lachnospiraceae bacterium]
MKIRVAVIFGGRSVEHEVSIISALQAAANMDTEKYEIIPVYLSKENEMYTGDKIGDIEAYKDIKALVSSSTKVTVINESGRYYIVNYPLKKFGGNIKQEIDIVFPIVHGTNVEDGTLAGYIKTLGIPFVGCDVTSSAVGMDKYIMKTVFKDNDIPVLNCVRFSIADYRDIDGIIKKTEDKLEYPVIVKPVNTGSSVGISIAKNRDELTDCVDMAFTFANTILIERAVENLQEINCSVLGDSENARASLCEEPFHSKEILSYEDKYLSGGKGKKGSGASKGMASVQRRIPAEIPDEMTAKIRELSVKAFKALDCCGVVRFDFMIDKDSNELFLNEINTIPGSLAFYLWEPEGLEYKTMLSELIELGLKRARDEKRVMFSFETNILNQASFKGTKK